MAPVEHQVYIDTHTGQRACICRDAFCFEVLFGWIEGEGGE